VTCGAAVRRLAAAALALSLAACATLRPLESVPATAAASDEPFVLGGRMSARRGDSGVAGAFTWTHDAHRDAIDLATPLGQTLAQLEGGAQGVSVRLQDGRTETAPTWRELTERAFGVVIPVDGLAAWVRGVPRAGTQATVERDANARVSLLRQDGWEVTYAYADDASRRPSRISLSYPGAPPVEVRIVVDRRE
jgi:outer membrane lipoprotein LolB